jgi:hypothetical protein
VTQKERNIGGRKERLKERMRQEGKIHNRNKEDEKDRGDRKRQKEMGQITMVG